MVNRVFCYSKEVAKQNGNKLPIMQLVLTTIIFIVALVAFAVFLPENDLIFILLMFVFFGIIIYFSVILGIRMRTRMTGWATTNDGRIFKVMTVNNGQGLYFGGIAAGSMIDQLIGNNSNIASNLGGTLGAAGELYSMNKSAQYMSHPEIVAKIVEEAPNVTGAEVYEILKVNSITDGSRSIKMNCDYKIVRTGKVKYNKNMSVEKSYNQMNDLVNILNTHRV
jgi:hypothetical protein